MVFKRAHIYAGIAVTLLIVLGLKFAIREDTISGEPSSIENNEIAEPLMITSQVGLPIARDNLVRVDILYEVLCPDSQRFFTMQIYPTYKKVGEMLDIRLYPFGKASYTPDGDSWSFKCQHGPKECEANTYHACVIEMFPASKDYLQFVNCVLDAPTPSSAAQKCANDQGLNFDKIKACANGKKGRQLLHEYGVATENLVKPLTYVPWVVVNGDKSQAIQERATGDFLELVCDKYKGERPDNCPKGNPHVKATNDPQW